MLRRSNSRLRRLIILGTGLRIRIWFGTRTRRSGASNQDGLYTAGTDIGSASEGVRVDFTRGNFTANYVVPVSVVLGPATTLAVTPEVVDTRVTWEVDMHAEVLDHVGHVLEDAEITWEVLRPGDEIDQTGHYTPNETMSAENASLVLVTATAGDVTLERIVKGTVGPGILDRVETEGSLLELKSGDEVQLTATGFDRFGHELELDEVMWEVDDPEIGSFSEDGVFTAGVKSGMFPENTVRVRGIKDGVQTFSDVPVSILPSQAVAIEFENEFDSVPAGSSSPIPLSVLDENGNAINDVDVYLEVTAGGALNQNLAFTSWVRTGYLRGCPSCQGSSGRLWESGADRGEDGHRGPATQFGFPRDRYCRAARWSGVPDQSGDG